MASTKVAEELQNIGNIIPENCYWGFSAYTQILPYVLKEIGHAAAKIPQASCTGPVWNYIDAACSIVGGSAQFYLRKQNHRPVATGIKGAMNVVSGGTLIGCTAYSFSLLGGPAFAAAFGIGFALSLEETLRHFRRWEHPSYWEKDTMAEINKLEKLILDLDKEIGEMEKAPQKNSLYNWALKKKRLRRDEYMENQKVLIADRKAGFSSPHVQEKNKRALIKSSINSLVWGIAFVGMLLMCIPGMQLAALGVIATASLIYFAKNGYKASKISIFRKKEEPFDRLDEISPESSYSHKPLPSA